MFGDVTRILQKVRYFLVTPIPIATLTVSYITEITLLFVSNIAFLVLKKINMDLPTGDKFQAKWLSNNTV